MSLDPNEEQSSPYYGLIKFPGTPRRKGGIALSTAVTAIKPLVEEKGDFEQIGITEFELQKQIVVNFFSALQQKYGDEWLAINNAFMYASGFVGAIDFLRLKLIPYCNRKKSFTQKIILSVVDLDAWALILQAEVKGKGGKDAPKIIYDRLVKAFAPSDQKMEKIEI